MMRQEMYRKTLSDICDILKFDTLPRERTELLDSMVIVFNVTETSDAFVIGTQTITSLLCKIFIDRGMDNCAEVVGTIGQAIMYKWWKANVSDLANRDEFTETELPV